MSEQAQRMRGSYLQNSFLIINREEGEKKKTHPSVFPAPSASPHALHLQLSHSYKHLKIKEIQTFSLIRWFSNHYGISLIWNLFWKFLSCENTFLANLSHCREKCCEPFKFGRGVKSDRRCCGRWACLLLNALIINCQSNITSMNSKNRCYFVPIHVWAGYIKCIRLKPPADG